jgi:hypothetical protein
MGGSWLSKHRKEKEDKKEKDSESLKIPKQFFFSKFKIPSILKNKKESLGFTLLGIITIIGFTISISFYNSEINGLKMEVTQINQNIEKIISQNFSFCDLNNTTVNVQNIFYGNGSIELPSTEIPNCTEHPTFVPAVVGNGAWIDDCYALLIPNLKTFETSTGTISMIVIPKWDSRENIPRFLVDMGRKFNQDRLSLFIDEYNNLQLRFFDSYGNVFGTSYDVSNWKIDEPHMITSTWNFDEGTINLYIDGTLTSSTIIPKTKFNISSGEGMFIGQDMAKRFQAFVVLDELMIFSDVKSKDWIKIFYLSIFGNIVSIGSVETID